MPVLPHISMALLAKNVTPKLPLGILLLASCLLDELSIILFLTVSQTSIWTHSLFMAIVWALIMSGIAWIINRNKYECLILGLLVLSHWVLDFIAAPMTIYDPSYSKLLIFLEGSPTVGLGFYTPANVIAVYIFELIMFILGIIIYVKTIKKIKIQKKLLIQDVSVFIINFMFVISFIFDYALVILGILLYILYAKEQKEQLNHT